MGARGSTALRGDRLPALGVALSRSLRSGQSVAPNRVDQVPARRKVMPASGNVSTSAISAGSVLVPHPLCRSHVRPPWRNGFSVYHQTGSSLGADGRKPFRGPPAL